MSMPSGEDLKIALRIMDWVYEDPEALEVHPEATRYFRRYVDAGLGRDEDKWRTAYDLALLVWKEGYERHLEDLF